METNRHHLFYYRKMYMKSGKSAWRVYKVELPTDVHRAIHAATRSVPLPENCTPPALIKNGVEGWGELIQYLRDHGDYKTADVLEIGL